MIECKQQENNIRQTACQQLLNRDTNLHYALFTTSAVFRISKDK